MPLTARDLQELVRLLEREPRWREALRAALWKEEDLVRWLRERLPRLLQEEPRFGAEVVGILAQTLSPRSELIRVLEEIRALREDMDRRFAAMDERFRALQEDMGRRFAAMDERFRALREDMDRRFEAMDERFRALQEDMDRRFEAMDERFRALQEDMGRRFEAMDERFRALQEDMDRRFRVQAEILDRHGRDLRYLRVGFGSLGRRFGLGFEEAVRGMVEEFAGVGPLRAERLVLRDEAGEVFGVPGQVIEFDAFVHDGDRFLVEVKAFAQREDVLLFRRKVEFAARQLGQTFRAVMVAPFAHRRAVETARELGVQILAAEEPPEGDA
ncbi:MAG: DUF3782 domain-containing protein [Armatimonadota bacterium]|nr:DUF3782 domain-containing protein [Armatimonadota bacterium]